MREVRRFAGSHSFSSVMLSIFAAVAYCWRHRHLWRDVLVPNTANARRSAFGWPWRARAGCPKLVVKNGMLLAVSE